jgi:diguanylate cyclase (GGDEF)-like protein
VHTLGLATGIQIPPQTLLCLVFLTIVVVLRQTGRGIFAIFLGRGIGGRIARLTAPILLFVPFIREDARAYFINAGQMPANYISAFLVSLASTLAFAFLLFLVLRIDRMENQIRLLSLRDELTGLYNFRGFHLLGDQTMRLAQRSQLPFSVLFIDLDNLKRINDSLGHDVGSACVAEMAALLKVTFRETDVIGRVGGDEFAVAGQFSRAAISIAAQRLNRASIHRNMETFHPFPLNFSMGLVTSEGTEKVSLKELLAKADDAMYEEKRRKKSNPD